jgi:DNA polymerase-3 subunit chi
MTEVSLYKLTTTPLEKTLPKLMEKIYSSGMRAVLMSSSKERVEALNKLLWTYTTTTFLPHGSQVDDFAEDQPIWLTNQLENPNNAQVLVLCDGASIDSLNGFKRCLDLYDGNDPKEISNANQRINSYVSQGCVITQWRQGEKGAWEKVTS